MKRLLHGTVGPLRQGALAGLAGLLLVGAGLAPAAASAQESSVKKAKGRLPPYYAQVVNDQQRQAIYAIQDKYAARIAALQEQLAALARQRDAEIEGVLTAEQRARLRELQEAAAAKRKKGTASEAGEVKEAEANPPPPPGTPAAGQPPAGRAGATSPGKASSGKASPGKAPQLP